MGFAMATLIEIGLPKVDHRQLIRTLDGRKGEGAGAINSINRARRRDTSINRSIVTGRKYFITAEAIQADSEGNKVVLKRGIKPQPFEVSVFAINRTANIHSHTSFLSSRNASR